MNSVEFQQNLIKICFCTQLAAAAGAGVTVDEYMRFSILTERSINQISIQKYDETSDQSSCNSNDDCCI